LLGWALACGSSPQTVSAQTCQTDADCDAGLYCNAAHSCQVSLGCTSNSQCTAPLTCNVQTGECLCTEDSDCSTGQVCNPTGHCQSPSSCFYNTDCPASFICDTASHACIPQGTCLSTVQCPLGEICSPTPDGGGACVTGCVQDGDCPLVTITGPGQTTYTPQRCSGGQCVTGDCNYNFECLFGEACVNSECQSACSTDAPYCQSCDPTSTDPNQCGGLANLCIIDPNDPASCTGPGPGCDYYCGVDCSTNACPAGYVCAPIVVVTGPGTGPDEVCSCGTSCADGSACGCDEGAQSGVCPCHIDGDCPTDSCLSGVCYVTGDNCNTDSDCLPVTCQQGSCVEAQNCAPSKQYKCTPGTGPCQGG
jgi:hypothetical protein